jgi:hypothetical protein
LDIVDFAGLKKSKKKCKTKDKAIANPNIDR